MGAAHFRPHFSPFFPLASRNFLQFSRCIVHRVASRFTGAVLSLRWESSRCVTPAPAPRGSHLLKAGEALPVMSSCGSELLPRKRRWEEAKRQMASWECPQHRECLPSVTLSSQQLPPKTSLHFPPTWKQMQDCPQRAGEGDIWSRWRGTP